jgi:hypothetical protein
MLLKDMRVPEDMSKPPTIRGNIAPIATMAKYEVCLNTTNILVALTNIGFRTPKVTINAAIKKGKIPVSLMRLTREDGDIVVLLAATSIISS